jgi:putative SOS response-associated peptidase YedK
MTRTWFSVPDQPVFAVAGIWRDTDEWGPAYSMVMTEACQHLAGVHDRMPVILRPDQWATWTDGDPGTAAALAVPYGGLMVVDRTDEPWFKGRATG